MPNEATRMTEEQRYLLDLQGFLVVENALTPEQVAALDAEVTSRMEQEAPEASTHRFGGLLTWGRQFRDLIDNPRILPYLEEVLGPGVRLDHDYCDVIRRGKGPIGTTLHGGGTPFDPVQFYRFAEGIPRSGLFVVAYNLRDVHPGDGGFGCVPGSHKANLPFPAAWRDLSQPHACTRAVTGPAGTAILFTEALTHGTLPWTGTGERRTLFYKYSPCGISWSARYYRAEDYPDLSERQRAMLEPPNARYPGRSTAP